MMRALSPVEEGALLFLASAPSACWRDLPSSLGPYVPNRLARLGLATVMVTGPQRRARLTKAGRYLADLVAAKAERS